MPPSSPVRVQAAPLLTRGRNSLRRWRHGSDRVEVVFFSVVALACAAMALVWPHVWPIGLMVFPMVVASLWMNPRPLMWYTGACMGLTVLVGLGQPVLGRSVVLRVLVVLLLATVILVASIRRTRLGVGGLRGESMFVDLRDRLQRQHVVPAVPPGWSLQHAIQSAEGTPYAGDFSIGLRDGDRLGLALVDVSGKGTVAGTRALFLSGAMSGLMGALSPARFLAECNNYLCRQDWDEGFATAVHVSVNLTTGEFEVRSAGHPPAIQWHAGSGRWTACQTRGGPALGLLGDMEYPANRGVLDRGDLLMLYTDGLVEMRGLDLDRGIDRLMGQAERELHVHESGVADRLVRRLGSSNDDCALVMLQRR